MLLGHWLEMRSIAQARGALAALAELLPDTAERVTGGGTEDRADRALRVGRRRPRPARARACPPTAIVVEGAADVDESMITGESRPVAKEPGDPVVAGTVAAGGSSASGSPRTATRPRSPGSCGWSRRPRPRPRGPRPSPTGPRRSCSTSPSPPARSPSSAGGCWATRGALVRTATVLVIACPHALGLAIPLVIAISTSLGARNGPAGQGPPGPRAGADPGHRHLRQDRHPHEGRARAR